MHIIVLLRMSIFGIYKRFLVSLNLWLFEILPVYEVKTQEIQTNWNRKRQNRKKALEVM